MSKLKTIIGRFRPYNGVKTPIVLQQSETECGIAALAILFAYFRYFIPFETLREQCGTSRDGCKALTLIRVAQTHQFRVDAFKIDIEDLYFLNQPVIAFWNFSHYVVINGVGTNKVFINDPAHGLQTVSLDVFDKAFTGIIIMLRPSPSVKLTAKSSVLRSMLLQWVHQYYSQLTHLLLLVLLSMVGTIGQTVFTNVMTAESHEYPANPLWLEAWIFIGWGLFFSCFNVVQKWQQFLLCANASLTKCADIIKHALELPFMFYTLRQKSEIVAILNRCDVVINAIYKNLTQCATHFLLLFACLFMMYQINSSLTYVAVITAVITVIGLFLTAKINNTHTKTNIHWQGKLYAHEMTSIKNLETIIACGLEINTFQKWQQLFIKKAFNQFKLSSLMSFLHVIQLGNQYFSSSLILFIAIRQIKQGTFTIEWLMSFYFLHEFFGHALNTVVHAAQDIQSAHASHMRINDIMRYPADHRYLTNKDKLTSANKSLVRCEDVRFFYNKTQPATLTNINCDIVFGEHIGIVGVTGSGKSTLAKLLAALYQPHLGQIFLHGVPLACYDAQTLANQIAYVPQDPAILPGTLMDNITLWQQHFSQKQIEEALHDACLEEVMAARGIADWVEGQESTFSGGERQRIEIARALLQATPLIIFDEATSALDVQTEMRLMNRLKRRQQTMIFVAHRLSTIQHADQIWVMDDGKIMAQGKHHQLLMTSKLYQNLWAHGETVV